MTKEYPSGKVQAPPKRLARLPRTASAMEPAIPQGAAVLGEAEKRRLALLRLAEVRAACQLEVVPAVPASGTGIVKLHSVAKHARQKAPELAEHTCTRARRPPPVLVCPQGAEGEWEVGKWQFESDSYGSIVRAAPPRAGAPHSCNRCSFCFVYSSKE